MKITDLPVRVRLTRQFGTVLVKSIFFETSFRSKDSQPFYAIGLYSHLKLSQWPVRDRAAVFIYVIVRSCSFNRTVFAAE